MGGWDCGFTGEKNKCFILWAHFIFKASDFFASVVNVSIAIKKKEVIKNNYHKVTSTQNPYIA